MYIMAVSYTHLDVYKRQLPSCCDCVYHPYCGVCPVINLALENNIYERRPNNYRCRIYKGILDTLFELIEDKEVEAIFTSWI